MLVSMPGSVNSNIELHGNMHVKLEGCGEVRKNDMARTFLNCSQLKTVWINSRLVLFLLLLILLLYLLAHACRYGGMQKFPRAGSRVFKKEFFIN